MKRLAAAVVLILLAYGAQRFSTREADDPGRDAIGSPSRDAPVDAALGAAIRERRSGVQVTGEGRVVRVLADDDRGSRHQRFVLRIASGETLLVAHNIDLAPRIASLREGDAVGFHGEYEWNEQGGVIHWTHHDPAGRHEDGWLAHAGRTYR